jgi:hypothetical protein
MHLRYALVGLVQKDLRHALDSNGKRNDGVLAARSACAVASTGAERTENGITGLTEQQLLQQVRCGDLAEMQRQSVKFSTQN